MKKIEKRGYKTFSYKDNAEEYAHAMKMAATIAEIGYMHFGLDPAHAKMEGKNILNVQAKRVITFLIDRHFGAFLSLKDIASHLGKTGQHAHANVISSKRKAIAECEIYPYKKLMYEAINEKVLDAII